MPENKELVVSALVVLRPASGRALDGKVAISAANLAEFAPAPDAVAAVAAALRARGFEVGPPVGISFSVVGTIRAFEECFGKHVRLGRDRGYEFVSGNKSLGHELSGRDLPEGLRASVHAVAFPLPPDFGPTEFHP